MKQSIIRILCCPLCKTETELQIHQASNDNVIEGSLVCSSCKNEYLIRDGIPEMYIPDNKIIAISNSSQFSQFIITPDNLGKQIANNKLKNRSYISQNPITTKYLLALGWFCVCISPIFYSLSNFNNNLSLFNIIMLPAFSSLFLYMSLTFFIIDYLRYRWHCRQVYFKSLNLLKELADRRQLSEYDIRTHAQDTDENFRDQFENQKSFASYKGQKIELVLKRYNFKVKNALNIGCGGALHKSASKPYFDKGYGMIGVDISQNYLKEFKQVFNTDVVQANSMALAFKSNKFDLINFTDIVEHLHHPFLGLKEARRVLKKDGVIILTTNNHCTIIKRCINPLIFFEKVISVYFDRILPPRVILGQWMQFFFYHTEFTKNEISRLLRAAGFEIMSFETQFPNQKKDKLNKIFKRLPVLRFMCKEFLIIGKKMY